MQHLLRRSMFCRASPFRLHPLRSFSSSLQDMRVYASPVRIYSQTGTMEVNVVPPGYAKTISGGGNTYASITRTGKVSIMMAPKNSSDAYQWSEKVELRLQTSEAASLCDFLHEREITDNYVSLVAKSGFSRLHSPTPNVYGPPNCEYTLDAQWHNRQNLTLRLTAEPEHGQLTALEVQLNAGEAYLVRKAIDHALPHLLAMDENLRPYEIRDTEQH